MFKRIIFKLALRYLEKFYFKVVGDSTGWESRSSYVVFKVDENTEKIFCRETLKELIILFKLISEDKEASFEKILPYWNEGRI